MRLHLIRWMPVLTLAGLFIAACDGNLPRPSGPELRELVLRDPALEDGASGLFAQREHTHRDVLESIAAVVKNEDAKGLLLQVGSFGGAWARVTELRRALSAVRAAKKPVHCYFEETDNSGYQLLAESCDRITMTPTGTLALVGVHAQLVHAKDLLDLLGVRADLMQVGRFKGAAEPLTRSDASDEVKLTLGAVLDALQADLAKAIMSGRKLSSVAFDAAMAAGPQTAQVALRLGLVDAVAFDDEARAHAKTAARADRVVRLLEPKSTHSTGLFELLRMLFGDEEEDDSRGKRVVLAYLNGAIDNGEEHGSSGASAGPFVAAMRKFADDTDVAALVLRIDSPGGSALASDRMWHAVRRVAKRKPVIVSIGDMAASGGYYVACAGSEIFAEDSSLVGSIGVVGGKIVLQDLADRAGVRVTSLARGPNSGWSSAMQPFSDGERKAVMEALEDTYRTFVSRVADGRKRTPAQLAEVVEGRIMTGAQARAGGLVDEAGGLSLALERARSRGGVGADVEVEVWPGHQSLLDRLTHGVSGADARTLSLSGLRGVMAPLDDSGLTTMLLSSARSPLAVLPYALTIH